MVISMLLTREKAGGLKLASQRGRNPASHFSATLSSHCTARVLAEIQSGVTSQYNWEETLQMSGRLVTRDSDDVPSMMGPVLVE
jgi:hypothetical protein